MKGFHIAKSYLFLMNFYQISSLLTEKDTVCTNHVLIRLTENWKATLDKNLFTGAVLMDLSKTFDCIPHDLLITKLHAYGLSLDMVTFPNSYFKRSKAKC